MRRLPPPLVVLTPGTLAEDERELARMEAAVGGLLAAGVRGLLVREPRLGDRRTLQLLKSLRARFEREAPDAWLGVHDRVQLAAQGLVDACHLGFRSLEPAEARAILPATVAIGLSTHARDVDAAESALGSEADYIFHGPVHPTPSKAGLVEPVGVAGIEAAAQATSAPLWALGGIAPSDCAALCAAGASGVAVLGGVWNAASLTERAAEYLAARGAQ